MKDFAFKLENWYKENQRDLPWRKTRDPYLIWISEIIFQQTRIEQGLEYYKRFIIAFPDIKSLATADEDSVLKQWQGLGYYSRARNIHKTAKILFQHNGGVFPTSIEEIIKLPGIGEYTAAAIVSFSFLQPFPVVDGNVIRFMSRLFGIETLFNTTSSKKELYAKLSTLINKKRPDIFNNAIMEFGALQCTPAKPNCDVCIFKTDCIAFKLGKVDELPVKLKKKSNPTVYLNYLVFIKKESDGKYTWIHQRKDKGIWRNLYDFPCIESNVALSIKQIQKQSGFINILSNSNYTFISSGDGIIHKLTHKTFYVHFHLFSIEKVEIDAFSGFLKIPINTLHEFPVSRLLESYIEGFVGEE